MNLTSKRVLQFMTVCAGACALSASAGAQWVADSFEEGTIGELIGLYKPVVIGSVAHAQWVSASGDASALVTTSGAYSGIRPMTTTTDKVLKLETLGQTLSRRVLDVAANPVPMPFDLTDVYVDTLIKFTPSEYVPSITDPLVKVAVYVNVNSNLVVYHKTDLGAGEITLHNVFDGIGIIDPTVWYRLTIQLGLPSSTPACKIFLNGQALSNANTLQDDMFTPGGPWFMNLSSGTSLSSVAFQGTGMVDELVVTDTLPDGIGSLYVYDQWLLAQVPPITQADMDAHPAWMNDYLLNVAHNSGSGIVIDSIVMTGNVATIVVAPSTVPVNFNDLHGVLKVKTSASLSTLEAATPVAYPITVLSGNGSASIAVTLPAGHTFIKAVVQ